MADDIRSMPAKVRKVDGGYELNIPDEIAVQAGIAEGQEVILSVVGNTILIQNLDHIERVRASEPIYSGLPQVRDPHEPYDPPSGFARVA